MDIFIAGSPHMFLENPAIVADYTSASPSMRSVTIQVFRRLRELSRARH
jgi:hypothetical protein